MHEIDDIDLMLELGMVPGELPESPFSIRWDHRGDVQEELDYDIIGEDNTGIWVRQHPDTLLLMHPELWRIVQDWRCTSTHDLTYDDLPKLSHWYLQAWITMHSAQTRKLNKRPEETTI